jgi:hypothetical protein
MPDLDLHLPPLGMGAEMARRSQAASLIYTPKQRLVAELHPNGTAAPKDLDRSTNGSAFERPTADSDLSISIGETCSVSRGDDSVLRRK